MDTKLKVKVTRIRSLINSGMPEKKACRQVGLNVAYYKSQLKVLENEELINADKVATIFDKFPNATNITFPNTPVLNAPVIAFEDVEPTLDEEENKNATQPEIGGDKLFGIALRQCRRERKMTQREFAAFCEIGTSTIGNIELGAYNGNIIKPKEKILNALKMTEKEFTDTYAKQVHEIKEMQQLTIEGEDLRSEIENLKEENKSLNDALSTNAKAYEELQLKYDADMKAISGNRNKALNENTNLQEEVKTLTVEKQNLENENKALNTKIINLEGHIKLLNDQLAAVDKPVNIEHLETRIADLESNNKWLQNLVDKLAA